MELLFSIHRRGLFNIKSNNAELKVVLMPDYLVSVRTHAAF